MATNTYKSNPVDSVLNNLRLNRGAVFGVIIITALLAFEIFNYGTTDYALGDLLGDLKFLGLRWATILAIAFCGIDFAGIARLFTPEAGIKSSDETWYLFGAWMLAATMNAMLTWWGVSLAILNNPPQGSDVIPHATMLRVAPVFVAVLVWLIRVLIIGTFSVAGDRLFSLDEQRAQAPARPLSLAMPAPARRGAVQPGRPPVQAPVTRSPTPATGYTSPARPPLPRAASAPARPNRTTYIEPPMPPEPEEPGPELTYLPVAALPTGRPTANQQGSTVHTPVAQRRF